MEIVSYFQKVNAIKRIIIIAITNSNMKKIFISYYQAYLKPTKYFTLLYFYHYFFIHHNLELNLLMLIQKMSYQPSFNHLHFKLIVNIYHFMSKIII